MNTIYISISGFPWIKVTERNQQIVELIFVEEGKKNGSPEEENIVLSECKRQILEYFSGKRENFTIPFCLTGTFFQQDVLRKLQDIPYGETKTYQQIAYSLGKEKAVRAVSKSIAKNPILLLIPCHRVIGKDGRLHGYSGGLEVKEKLLKLEKNSKINNVNQKN